VERSTKKRKARVKYADRNGVSVTIRIWKDEYQCLLRYAEDIAKIRGMPKRLPIGETIAYMVRYFNAAQSERWKDVLCIARHAFGIQDELDRSLKRFELPRTTPHSRSTAL